MTTIDAKGVFPMDHPLHMGIYQGPFSAPAVGRRVREADLVLALGTVLTDMNLGAARPEVRRERSIWALADRVQRLVPPVHRGEAARLRLGRGDGEASALPREGRRTTTIWQRRAKRRVVRGRETTLSVNDLLLEVNDFLWAHRRYHVFAESGDMLFGGLELRLREGGLYFSQGYYASMGFAVPAALGAQIGTGVRPLVLSGDGAFQMTGSEIAQAPARGLSPIVVVVNNAGWGIFRPVSPRADLLRIPPWPYAEMARGWGGVGFEARSREDLREALRAAHEHARLRAGRGARAARRPLADQPALHPGQRASRGRERPPVTPAPAGQLLFVGFQGTDVPDDLVELVAAGRIGGVVLFARNVESPEQLCGLTRRLHAEAPADAPLLVAVDQEGGRVQRLRDPWTVWPPMRQVGDHDDPVATRAFAAALAARAPRRRHRPRLRTGGRRGDRALESRDRGPQLRRDGGACIAARLRLHRGAAERRRGRLRQALSGPRRHHARQPPRAAAGCRTTWRGCAVSSCRRSARPSKPASPA